MPADSVTFNNGDRVKHPQFGIGTVSINQDGVVLVLFAKEYKGCLNSDLTLLSSVSTRLAQPAWDVPLEVISRTQAEAIISVNDSWGVFLRWRIELLPHQLWVCHKVNSMWPTHWLVADDVGLGKTIEAGMILLPLMGRRIHRLLIICPARLAEQWQDRLINMFDVRPTIYNSVLDTAKNNYWKSNSRVIASLQTLKLITKGRRDRLIESEGWNMVIVDESHHLNADEAGNITLGYDLISDIVKNGLVESMLFFTGTPHLGKNYNFLAQLNLLQPGWFQPKGDFASQLGKLRNVMIRNNKYSVTDINGTVLFQKPDTVVETYTYSEDEQSFYDMLTDFIEQGKLYAGGLDARQRSAVNLVLVTMQKLASSSIAAARAAISGRLNRIEQKAKEVDDLSERIDKYHQMGIFGDGDEVAQEEERLAEELTALKLVENEVPELQKLLNAAGRVREETKIQKILDLIRHRFAGRTILFFTEYKATQSLLMSSLISEYGTHCVTFINGDNQASNVAGAPQPWKRHREDAADDFNAGSVRFLVSTEAGGEGIDLQENCHTLIHVDLPWNPMRLHQRVGRVNRYGQTKKVDVAMLKNPGTVESRIMALLETKLNQIVQAYAATMDEAEDLKEIVLGMTSTSFYNDLYYQAPGNGTKLSNWFDAKTGQFGNKDAIDAARQILGNASKFDFKDVSGKLPKVDLPDLQPFFELALKLNGRKMTETGPGISFKTPDDWLTKPAIRRYYDGMHFDRKDRSKKAFETLLGMGHRLFEEAIKHARNREVMLATIPKSELGNPVAVFRIQDQITTGVRPSVLAAVEMDALTGQMSVLRDWELLKLLNQVKTGGRFMDKPSVQPGDMEKVKDFIEKSEAVLRSRQSEISQDFQRPLFETIAGLWPD